MSTNHGIAERISMNPEDAEHGLAQLVLTILALLRQLVERQVIKRVEGGTLTDEQGEKPSTALLGEMQHSDQYTNILEILEKILDKGIIK